MNHYYFIGFLVEKNFKSGHTVYTKSNRLTNNVGKIKRKTQNGIFLKNQQIGFYGTFARQGRCIISCKLTGRIVITRSAKYHNYFGLSARVEFSARLSRSQRMNVIFIFYNVFSEHAINTIFSPLDIRTSTQRISSSTSRVVHYSTRNTV